MNDFDSLGDNVKTEIDKRKIQKLVEQGVVTPSELQNAPLVEVGPPGPPFGKVLKVTCMWQGECGREFPDLAQFERHVALDHLDLQEVES